MEKTVQIYDLHDPKQVEDEKKYWQSKAPEERLAAAESSRLQLIRMKTAIRNIRIRFMI